MIEEAFNALKAVIKRRFNDPDIQGRLLDPQGAARNQQTLLGYRMIILEVVQEILDTREAVNADKCIAFHRQMFALPSAMHKHKKHHTLNLHTVASFFCYQ